jgi:hypothetical protein
MKQFLIPKLINFNNWDKAAELTDFTYPWEKEEPPATNFKACYDQNHLHFRFIASGPKPLIYIDTNDKMEVIHSERVELFFRINEKMQPYYCLEMDPNGRVLDYKANHYREFDRSWHWPDSLSIKTRIEDENQGYMLQGKISLSVLKQLGLIHNNQIEIGIYRGHCTNLKGNKATIKWISWVDSKTKHPDFHVPSSFGVLKFQQ